DDEELSAVTAHELAHLAEPRGVLALRIATAYLPLIGLMSVPLAFSFGPVGLTPLAVCVLIAFVHRRGGRRMGERSDRAGRVHEGESAGTYARALEKIYEANLVPVVIGKRKRVHPELYDRMIAAGVTPAYARPAPPPRDLLASVMPILLFWTAMVVAMTT